MSSAWLPDKTFQANHQAVDNVWSIYAETKEQEVPSIQVSPSTTLPNAVWTTSNRC